MNNELHNSNTEFKDQKKAAKQVILLGLPFLFICVAIIFLSIFSVNFTYSQIVNSQLGLLFNAPENIANASTVNDNVKDVTINPNIEGNVTYYNIKDFPILQWGDKWATLSIPDGGVVDEPVYIGDTTEVLNKGIGKYFGSSFPGEGGNVVLSAHVNRQFYCLQDLPIGAQIILKTVYGEYVYEITDTVIFNYTDASYILEQTDEEQLLCYTCYPRGVAFRTERYAVICKKISGVIWR